MHVRELCALLEVEVPPDPRTFRSYEHARELLRAWKTGPLKRAYKACVKKCHPDRGGDPEEFKRIDAAYKHLRDVLKIRRKQPRAAPMRVGHVYMGGFNFAATSTSSTTASASDDGQTVTIIWRTS